MMTTHTQCTLQKRTTVQTSWIPSEFARKNRYVGLKTEDGWDEGWKVISVGTTMQSEWVAKREQQNRTLPPSLAKA